MRCGAAQRSVVAVSPIVGGAAVSGPAGALMQMMGWPSTIAGVAKAYEDFLERAGRRQRPTKLRSSKLNGGHAARTVAPTR